ncbi:MAG: TonB-dependent receptor [Bacteroidales bacterium]|nr:TonB-dependent receptor [Bacteroidales bacterium]
MKSAFCIISLILISLSGYNQNCFKGKVVDSKTQKPLVGVTVKVLNKAIGTVTDLNGVFSLCDIVQKSVDLSFSHVGYKSISKLSINPSDFVEVSLSESPIALDQIVVTATLTPQSTWEVPALVSVIDSVRVRSQSALNTDNYLRTIPGLYIDRSNGVFSKNAAVTMRGLDGSNRVLILYDGAPLNKTSYGFINWSLISPDMVDQIEVVHGPSSALFGNNAMAGVINIRTKEPLNSPFYGSITGEAGGFGLYGTRAMLGGKIPVLKKGISIMANGFYRKGDGYIVDPPETRDSTSAKSYINEKGLVVKAIIPISDSSTFYIGGNLYEDKRGAGRAVYMSDGSFDAYTTKRLRFGYNGEIEKFKLEIYGYAQRENYYRQNEAVNTAGDYKLFHTFQVSGDLGLWANASRKISAKNELIGGVDLKHGWMDAEDIYRTSTDDVQRKGKVTFAAMFLQDEQTFFDSKLKVLGGLRFDVATFFDGLLKVTDPTKNTGFGRDTLANFPKSSWNSLNPKLGIRYLPNKWLSIYGSVASGFMPAKLDDLCSTRKITKGFKLANPNLKPENLLTYELGGGLRFNSILRLDAALYLSKGYDFQYFVSTGDSIDTGGDGLKPIVKRENITSVRILGGEISVSLNPFKWLIVRGNYSQNHSEITDFKANPLVNIDLKGKSLAEVPLNQASGELILQNRFVNAGLVWVYIGSQWGDEVNSYKIDSWNTFNLRFWKDFKSIKLTLDIQDLLDNPYTDKKGLISPGRFFQFSATYSFK